MTASIYFSEYPGGNSASQRGPVLFDLSDIVTVSDSDLRVDQLFRDLFYPPVDPSLRPSAYPALPASSLRSLILPSVQHSCVMEAIGRLEAMACGSSWTTLQTWTKAAASLRLYCVPITDDSISGNGFYMGCSSVKRLGLAIPLGFGVIWWRPSLEEAMQCRVLVHELAHHLLEKMDSFGLFSADLHHQMALQVEAHFCGPRE